MEFRHLPTSKSSRRGGGSEGAFPSRVARRSSPVGKPALLVRHPPRCRTARIRSHTQAGSLQALSRSSKPVKCSALGVQHRPLHHSTRSNCSSARVFLFLLEHTSSLLNRSKEDPRPVGLQQTLQLCNIVQGVYSATVLRLPLAQCSSLRKRSTYQAFLLLLEHTNSQSYNIQARDHPVLSCNIVRGECSDRVWTRPRFH